MFALHLCPPAAVCVGAVFATRRTSLVSSPIAAPIAQLPKDARRFSFCRRRRRHNDLIYWPLVDVISFRARAPTATRKSLPTIVGSLCRLFVRLQLTQLGLRPNPARRRTGNKKRLLVFSSKLSLFAFGRCSFGLGTRQQQRRPFRQQLQPSQLVRDAQRQRPAAASTKSCVEDSPRCWRRQLRRR